MTRRCQHNSLVRPALFAAVGVCWASVGLSQAQVAVPPPAEGQPPAPPASEQRVMVESEIPSDLLAQLDSPELLLREAATKQVGSSGRFGMSALRGALSRTDLTSEQRQRLLSAGYEIFKATPRGAMGVQFEGATAAGVLVRPAQAGFDASRVLKTDDVIRAIDGRRVEEQDEIRVAIISREPGESLPLTIVRDGVPIETSVRLGSYSELRNSQGLDESVLSAAWSYRVAREGGAGAQPPVPSGLSAEQWDLSAQRQRRSLSAKNEPTHDPFTGEQIRSPLPRPMIAALAMGGQVRDQLLRAADQLAGGGVRIRGNEIILINPNQRARAGRGNQIGGDPTIRNALIARKQALTNRLQEIAILLSDRSISAERRAELKAMQVQVSTQSAMIQQEINDLFRQP